MLKQLKFLGYHYCFRRGTEMKNKKQELLGRMQRQYHQKHQWRLNKDGLYIPHSYAETKLKSLSLCDDVGFILNDRRVIVWWQHPRYIYSSVIEEQSRDRVGPNPQDGYSKPRQPISSQLANPAQKSSAIPPVGLRLSKMLTTNTYVLYVSK